MRSVDENKIKQEVEREDSVLDTVIDKILEPGIMTTSPKDSDFQFGNQRYGQYRSFNIPSNLNNQNPPKKSGKGLKQASGKCAQPYQNATVKNSRY